MFNSPVPIPQKQNWAHLYIKAEGAETTKLRALIERWCAVKGKKCNIVVVSNRELPPMVRTLPCLRTPSGYVNGSREIKRFLEQELKTAPT